MTGARAATSYGERVTAEMAGELAALGRIIVAGGAYGIEGAAHRAAVTAGAPTIAVLAGGVDRAYPAGHAQLLEQIREHGVLISEFPLGSSPTRTRFVARGRVLAALSGASTLMESRARSDALRVMAEALQLGRGVGRCPCASTYAAMSRSVSSSMQWARLENSSMSVCGTLRITRPGCGRVRAIALPIRHRRAA